MANAQEIDGRMELVDQVRDVFPGLETAGALEAHRATVLYFMAGACAVCAVESGSIAGGLLLSRDAARAFNERMGSREGKLTEEFGCSVQEFRLPRQAGQT